MSLQLCLVEMLENIIEEGVFFQNYIWLKLTTEN